MSKNSTQWFSIFGQCEQVVAEMMIKEGKVVSLDMRLMDRKHIFNAEGRKAMMVVSVKGKYVAEFNNRCAELRA